MRQPEVASLAAKPQKNAAAVHTQELLIEDELLCLDWKWRKFLLRKAAL